MCKKVFRRAKVRQQSPTHLGQAAQNYADEKGSLLSCKDAEKVKYWK